MSLIKRTFDTSVPLPSILPKRWGEEFVSNDNVIFDSLDQFIFVVSKLTQKQDDYCDVTYKTALQDLIGKKGNLPEEEQDTIRNLVRSNLLKRGLITEEVYESYRYTSDGTQVGVDVGKYATGDPECVMSPTKRYIDFFYELYVNISYPGGVPNENVKRNVAKLLATVEELERRHIFIKINAVFPAEASGRGGRNFFSIIPIFSHKDLKSVSVMSSVINERLLRKFYFAILEDFYGDDLSSGYGRAVNLTKTINIGSDLDEVEFFEEIVKEVGA